jgi:hypothetical protein
MIIIYGNGLSGSWGMVIFAVSILFSMFSNQSWYAESQALIFFVIFCLLSWYGIVQLIDQVQGQPTNQSGTNDGTVGSNPTSTSQTTQAVTEKISTMPLESYCPPDKFMELSVKELKQRLKNRSIKYDANKFVEKIDFVKALASHHSSEQTSCVICFEDFDQETSVIRVLPACQHCFHIECIDRWAFSSQSRANNDSSSNTPSCPLCKTEL